MEWLRSFCPPPSVCVKSWHSERTPWSAGWVEESGCRWCQSRAAHVWLKYALMLGSHVLPDSMVTNPSLLPIFPLYLVSSGTDYTGLDSLPEADMHSFIKKPKCSCSHASCQNAPAASKPSPPAALKLGHIWKQAFFYRVWCLCLCCLLLSKRQHDPLSIFRNLSSFHLRQFDPAAPPSKINLFSDSDGHFFKYVSMRMDE